MARLRYNGLQATLGAALTATDTTITFAAPLTHSGGTAVPTLAGGDYIPIGLLDSTGALREIVNLTAYTTGATTGTIVRAQESTTATTHATTGRAVNGPTAADIGAPPAFAGARIATSATQSIASGLWVVVNFDAETFDVGDYHNNTTNPHRFTVPAGKAGKYRLSAVVSYALNSSGYRFISLMKNGTIRTAIANLPAADGTQFRTRVATEDVFDLAVGDYLHVEAFQNSGSSLEVGDTTSSGAAGETFAVLEYIGT